MCCALCSQSKKVFSSTPLRASFGELFDVCVCLRVGVEWESLSLAALVIKETRYALWWTVPTLTVMGD